MVTAPDTLGATSHDFCLVPPGHGFDAVTKSAAPCGAGRYNEGYNREPCESCSGAAAAVATAGGAFTTDGATAESENECYVPAAHGLRLTEDGTWFGYPCPNDTFGLPMPAFGGSNVTV